MPGKIQWITHSGKEILLNDRSNLRDNDIIENSNEAVAIIKGSGKKDILYLVDNSNTIIVPKVKEHIKKAGKDDFRDDEQSIDRQNSQNFRFHV